MKIPTNCIPTRKPETVKCTLCLIMNSTTRCPARKEKDQQMDAVERVLLIQQEMRQSAHDFLQREIKR